MQTSNETKNIQLKHTGKLDSEQTNKQTSDRTSKRPKAHSTKKTKNKLEDYFGDVVVESNGCATERALYTIFSCVCLWHFHTYYAVS